MFSAFLAIYITSFLVEENCGEVLAYLGRSTPNDKPRNLGTGLKGNITHEGRRIPRQRVKFPVSFHVDVVQVNLLCPRFVFPNGE